MTATSETTVLIIGAGPVGLALAIELGLRGVPCTVVEQGDGTIYHPRANTVNSRTMEFCRRWGVSEEVIHAGTPPDFPSTILYLTSLQGYELARIERPTYGGGDKGAFKPLATAPERSQRCNQLFFDPILRRRAQSFPSVSLRYGCRFDSFVETADGVVATVHDLAADRAETIAARYLVACCGGHSTVPAAIGARMEGDMVVDYHLNVFLRIPNLWERHDKGKAAFYFFINRVGNNPSLIELDGNELWRLGLRLGGQRLTPEQVDVPAVIDAVMGRGIAHEIISTMPWTQRSIVADRWSKGRVFLAGDAVHQHGPATGLGMNTGVGDAVDLGWKLAATVAGWAGPNLLASYEAERRPVAQRVVSEVREVSEEIAGPATVARIEEKGPEGDALRRRLGEDIVRQRTRVYLSDGIALGYRYDPSPVIVPDGSAPPKDSVVEYIQTSRPGSRAPHAWLAEGRSTIDLFGERFMLLAFDGAAAEAGAFEAAARARGVPLAVAPIADPAVAGLYEKRLVLVRPDGHVAWRGDAPPADPRAVIDTIRGA